MDIDAKDWYHYVIRRKRELLREHRTFFKL